MAKFHYRESPTEKQRNAFKRYLSEDEELVLVTGFSKAYIRSKFLFNVLFPGMLFLALGLGMPIHPIIDGEVTTVGRDLFGLGNYVEIVHEKGFKSKYGHMGKIYVKKGDKVTSENILGEVGLTGHTSGPHTHLEITLNGKYIDPQALLPELPKR